MTDRKTFLLFATQKDLEYLRALKAAIYHYEGPEKGGRTIRRYLGRRRLGEFNLVNPYARKAFRECLLMEVADLEGSNIPGEGVVMLATFAHRGWVCCDRAYDFDFDKARQKVRNAFAGMDYIAVIEAAVYPESAWTTNGTTGCMVSFHCHAVVWSSSKSKLARHKKKITARFEPVDDEDTKTYPVLDDLKTIMDLLRVVRYATKMPLEGYRRKQRNGNTTQEHVPLKAGHHYRLFKFLRRHSLFDAWFAGGEGAVVLRAVRAFCHKQG